MEEEIEEEMEEEMEVESANRAVHSFPIVWLPERMCLPHLTHTASTPVPPP